MNFNHSTIFNKDKFNSYKDFIINYGFNKREMSLKFGKVRYLLILNDAVENLNEETYKIVNIRTFMSGNKIFQKINKS